MTIRSGRIDVHHHNIPPAFVKTFADMGFTKVAGTPLPKWTPEKSIEVMDANGIQTAITSLSAPGVHLGGGVQQAMKLARQCNEFSAEMAAKYPERFGSFAVLPMPFTEAACSEAVYALDTLKTDGIVLLGSTDGKFLGDPSFDELMAELNRREAIVFEHPNIHATSDTLALNIPGFFVEFLCDTTRASLNLILSGTMEKYPKIKWILSHSGGFLPYIAWRTSLANGFPEFVEKAPGGILSYIQKFYYDTALSPSRFSQVVLKELVDPSHILFGSDFPFAPAPVIGLECKQLSEVALWTPEQQYGINRGHALKLFPKYKYENETVSPQSKFDNMSAGQRIKKLIAKNSAKVLNKIASR
jgi:predicted TIM-barrel fold metal-dependent hydrolase